MTKSDERGVALPFALLVLSLLIMLILNLDADARRELKEAAVFRDGFKAATLTRSGVQAARATLRRDVLLDVQAGRSYDALTELWATPISPKPLGDGIISSSIEDERGKLNLNDLASSTDAKVRTDTIVRFKRLFTLLQVGPEIVDAIADWVDADDVPEKNGAERAYYEALNPPYQPANMALQSLDELHLVKGMTREIVQRLGRYVTVYPTVSDGWININTAEPVVIEVLSPRITPALALNVVQGRPFRAMQDVDRVSDFEAIAKELRLTGAYVVESDHFTIRISATANEVTKNARAVVRRSRTNGDTEVIHFQID
jgi:general secretion pathway protein K